MELIPLWEGYCGAAHAICRAENLVKKLNLPARIWIDLPQIIDLIIKYLDEGLHKRENFS